MRLNTNPFPAVLARVALAASSIAFAASPANAAFDHLQCFKIKDALAKATYTADIDPSDPIYDAVPANCEIKTPAKLLCVDAEKTNVSPAPPGADDGVTTQPYLCYKAKCTKVQPTDSLTDQFGLHSIEVKSTKMVCAPVPAVVACPDTDGDSFTTCGGDCDDMNQTVNPGATEVCNAVDDNCNGSTDESDPGAGQACMTGQPGVCASGTTQCEGGALSCVPSISASSEVCDNQDNDCDGTTDDGNPGGGFMCSTGMLGVCSSGTTQCTGGMLMCNANTGPSSEVCDNQDNDCNGITDEGNPGGGVACNTGNLGVCALGTTACQSGMITCSQNQMASSEICDGLDNDCDGTADDGVCLPDGAACTMNSNCLNSNCVDGVCCNTACFNTCEACSTAKKGSGVDGTCGFIAAGTDPDDECAGAFTCTGAGACQP